MRQLVLLGAGDAHVHVLSTLANKHLPSDVQVTLLAPSSRQLCLGMVPGFVAGHYTLEQCAIALEPWLKKTSVRCLPGSATALHADTRTITLNDGSKIVYDWLSVNTPAVQDRTQIEKAMPGACEFGLFIRPIESFCALWPQVANLGAERALRVAVIGAEVSGIELAMAIRQRLPQASLTLITGGGAVGADITPAAAQRVVRALKERHITVLCDVVQGIQAGEVLLGCGARLACDVPVIAIGVQAPSWLAGSGLALDKHGFVAVNASQRSTSHPQVFAAHAVRSKADQTLAHNLVANMVGTELAAHRPERNTLSLLSCGDRDAIASWGAYSVQGRWVGWFKERIDRSFVKRYNA